MDIFRHIKSLLEEDLHALQQRGILPGGVDLSAIVVEPPRDASHGHMATNAAMVLAKRAGTSPRELASHITELLQERDEVEAAEIAGPGFINLRVAPSLWNALLGDILTSGNSYGNSDIGAGRRVNVEYVSANPTGPMHIGHGRGAVLGDVLSRLLLKTGHNVTREYYINDAGAQVDVLARSAYLRYREAMGRDIGEIPDGYYPGEYLIAVGRAFAQEHGDEYMDKPEDVWLPIMRDFALEAMMQLIRADLLDMGVQHDVFTSEKAVACNIDAVIDLLAQVRTDQGALIYRGVLEPPKGKLPDDWPKNYEGREQLLLRSTEYGDDVDRPLKKSDDTATYFASDIAYHHDKIARRYDDLVLVLGADHGGYVKRMQAAVAALSDISGREERVRLQMMLCQLVQLKKGGVAVKMSKRAGNFVTVRDVLDAVGKDALRFIMLTRKADSVLDFDLEAALEQTKDNPVFYVQYAHARASSVLRTAAQDAAEALEGECDDYMAHLRHPQEEELLRHIASFPRVVERAATHAEPHLIAFYLYDLASLFHALWNVGRGSADIRFIIPSDIPLTRARLALVRATRQTLASGLDTIGITPSIRM